MKKSLKYYKNRFTSRTFYTIAKHLRETHLYHNIISLINSILQNIYQILK